jgi:putative ABC transport system permease protein
MIPVRYNIRSLAVRKATTLATGLGVALVVFVLASALMLSAGIRKTLGISGRADTAIVLRQGSDAELGSSLEEPDVNLVLAAPGVKKGPGGPEGVGEVVVVAAIEKFGATGVSNVQMRGVTDDVMKFRPEAKILAGRAPQPGSDEVLIGKRLAGRFKGLDLDQSFDIKKNRPVKVVGIFETGGSSYESEVWVDRELLRAAYGRQGHVSSVRVHLDSPSSFDAFQASIEQDKRLGLMAQRESDYYEKQSEGTSKFIGAMGTLIAVFFSMGAMIGAMITMYAAVANRQREIGTLRALGFSRASILGCFLLEAVILALAGGLVGATASLAMGYVHFSMLNMASWSEIVFSFDPTPAIILRALVFAGVMGLLGGFFPALQASRVSPVAAMRGA